MKKLTLAILCCCLALGVSQNAFANVYAAHLDVEPGNGGTQDFSSDASMDITYRLNEAATSVSIEIYLQSDPGTTVKTIAGTTTKGLNTVQWDGTKDGGGNAASGTYSYKITAADTTGHSSWEQIDDSDTNALLSFYTPRGISINKNQDSSRFGTVYVSESNFGTARPGHAAERTTTTGVYLLTNDLTDLGHKTGGVDWAAVGSSAPLKSCLDADDHLYVIDFTNDEAYEFNADLSVATKIISAANKTVGQYCSGIYVEGTQAGGDRKLYVVNSHYGDGRRGLIQYDLGSAATPTGTGTQYIGPSLWTYYPYDVARDSNGDWYMHSYRATAGQEFPLAKINDGTPPLNTAAWAAATSYVYSRGIDINEDAGIAVYASYSNGGVYIFNIDTGAYIEEIAIGGRSYDLAFDAAGNLYVPNTSNEVLRVFSPGDGSNSFVTDYYGTVVVTAATGVDTWVDY